MQPEVQAFFHEPTNTVSYVIKDPQSKACAIIDPVLDYDPASGRTSTVSAQTIAAFVESNKLQLRMDFGNACARRSCFGRPLFERTSRRQDWDWRQYHNRAESLRQGLQRRPDFRRDGSQFDALFDDGAVIGIGGLRGRAIHTPGHTPACMTYIFGDAAFIGDTLFMPDYGTARCDFPGGDAAPALSVDPDDFRIAAANASVPVPRLSAARPHRISMGTHGRRAASA